MLGLEWLDIFGNVWANFRDSRLTFLHEGALVTLKGEPKLCYGRMALRLVVKTLEEGGPGF